MVRKINVFITSQQDEAIKQLKKKTGIKQSEAIRRALDEYIKKELN